MPRLPQCPGVLRPNPVVNLLRRPGKPPTRPLANGTSGPVATAARKRGGDEWSLAAKT